MVALARTALFVPATRPERIPKALAAGADHVVVDLEDAVAADAKDSARAALADFLRSHPDARVLVRVNGADTPEFAADIALCAEHAGVVAVMLPKAESARQIAAAAKPGKPVWPIIESALGVANVTEIARAPGVAHIAFGTLDFGVDLDMDAASPGAAVMLDHVRCQIALASRAAGIGAPIDGVYAAFDDAEGLRRYAQHGRGLGFGGMLCIHPAQVKGVHAAYLPAEADVSWARRTVAEAERTGLGAFQVDGKMVDAPVIARARGILARAG